MIASGKIDEMTSELGRISFVVLTLQQNKIKQNKK